MGHRLATIVVIAFACGKAPPASTSVPLLLPLLDTRYPVGLYAGVGSDLSSYSDYYDSVQTLLAGSGSGFVVAVEISGINVSVNWSAIEPNGPGSGSDDWSALDGVFDAVTAWNTMNPTNVKYVKVNVQGGFGTPPWALAKLTSCDADTSTGACGAGAGSGACGAGMFIPAEPGYGTVARLLPLPWDATYQGLWATFLAKVGARYGANRALSAVSINGPTASSNEIMEATGDPSQPLYTTNLAEWQKALCRNGLPISTQSFVKPWNDAIDLYGSTFSRITLVLVTGASYGAGGLPELGGTVAMGAGFGSSFATGEDGYCTDATHPTPTNDCAAETQILAHFIDPSVGGGNAKATSMEGMFYGCDTNPSLGLHGVKLLSAQTDYTATPILGGAGYISPIAEDGQNQGCGCPLGCTPACMLTDAAAFSMVMSQAFKDTAAAPFYGAAQDYTAPFNFVDVFRADVNRALDETGMGSALAQAATALVDTSEVPPEPPPGRPCTNPMTCN
jgi:hypothetical protein